MSFLEGIVGFLAPPICINCEAEGLSLCGNCSLALQPFGERCFRCAKLSPNYKTCSSCRKTGSPSMVIATTIYEGLAKKLVQNYKYDQRRPAAETIARLMAGTFRTSRVSFAKEYLIVPVPTASRRVRERGFDNGVLLAKILARHLSLPCNEALFRVGQTRQVGSARTDRLLQMDGAFRFSRKSKVINKAILLVDDVVTTGATLNEASKVLRLAGASSVDAIAFAKKL